MKQIVKTAKFLNTIIAKTFGIEIKRISILPQIKDDVFQSILDKVKDYTFLREEGLHSLFRQMKFIEQSNRKGCIVECGVWKGGVASLLAGTNLQYSREMRTIHLFDAFDDICAPSKIDGERANQEADKFLPYKSEGHKIVPLKGFYDEHGGHGTIEECMDLMIKDLKYGKDFIQFHKGWFQDTIPHLCDKIQDIVLLHIDADWYESTKICLEYLYPKVIKGGFIIIDDYGTYDGCKNAVDEFIQKLEKPIFLNEVDESIVYFMKE